MKKHRTGKVETALLEICKKNPDFIEEWENLIKFNASQKVLMEALHGEGYKDISITNISNWWGRNKPTGQKAVTINLEAESYKGINSADINQMAIAINSHLASSLYKAISEEDIKKASTATKISNLIECLKELRINSSELANCEIKHYALDLKTEGALILGENLKEIFKDSAFYNALEKAIDECINLIK